MEMLHGLFKVENCVVAEYAGNWSLLVFCDWLSDKNNIVSLTTC